MKNKQTANEILNPLENRDFIKEYNELLQKFGFDVEYVNDQWHENNGHIKKFTMLETTPTPTLSNNTQ